MSEQEPRVAAAKHKASFGMRPPGGTGEFYNPARDFAYNYPQLLACVCKAFESSHWPEVKSFVAAAMNVTEEQAWESLCDVNDAMMRYVNICCEDPTETVEDLLKRSGFVDLPNPARIGYMAMIGMVMVGQLFAGLRDVTPLGNTRMDVSSLLRHGLFARNVLNGNPEQFGADEYTAQMLNAITHLVKIFEIPRKEIRNMVDKQLASDDSFVITAER